LSEFHINTIYERLRRVGAAIAQVNGNNTHSGNLSMRAPHDSDLFYITSSGSQGGTLLPQDIVPVRFSGVSWGDARGSTESTVHRRILSLPEVNSVVHGHYIYLTLISFDSKEKQLFLKYLGNDEKGREEFLFRPVDLYGAHCIGSVRVGSYHQPVGSAEMEERIPLYLGRDKMTIVRGHGPFVRAGSPEEALYLLSVLENSAKIVVTLRRRGLDVGKMQSVIGEIGEDCFFPARPHVFQNIDFSICEVEDPTIIEDFRQRLHYNYNHQLGAYATGSMSQKITADTMIYCPMSSIPKDFEFPLFRKQLSFEEDDSSEIKLHKLVYQNTHQNTCMVTTSPVITAEGMAVLAENYGLGVLLNKTPEIPYTTENHPMVRPIDAEAIYLNPRLGLVDISQVNNMTPQNPILNMLRWHKGCCVVAGYGVISTGETTLEQAAHNAASAERIANFRTEVFMNAAMLEGPPLSTFEPGKN